MGEHAWHKKVREELFSKQQPNKAYQSHSAVSKLGLFRVEAGERLRRSGCLSDADIVVFDPTSGRINTIIEIESALNPIKIMGIVIATHLCNFCRIMKIDYELESIRLEIVYKKAPSGNKKDLKLATFGSILNEIVIGTKGCLTKLIFTPHE